jgi:hypothetical protein
MKPENLKARNALIRDLRAGLAGAEPMTLDAIGRRFGLTRERVRQILKAPFHACPLHVQEFTGAEAMEKLLRRSLDEFVLSVRASNCLDAAGIRTIGQLVNKTEREMMGIQHFGEKTMKEIKGLLNSLRVDGRPLSLRTIPKDAPLDVRSMALMSSMRDCFAAAALTGICANPGWTCAIDATVEEAYRLAEAMMAVREARWEVGR